MRFILPLLLFATAFVFAQGPSGWQHIQNNNFVAARAAFEETLAQKPADEPALVGLLFVAETVQDAETYERAAKRLIETWKPPYVWLLGHLYSGRPEMALNGLAAPQPLFSEQQLSSLRLPFVLAQADTLFRYRDFEGSKKQRQRVLPDWNWSISGPFTNEAGSGYIETTSVETAPFDPAAAFSNEAGFEFTWVKRRLFAPGTPVDFTALAESNGLNTYYANTFITVPDTRPVALCVTRTEPIKIWLDGQLLLALPTPTAKGQWDATTINLQLSAGTHRLLVKLAEFPGESKDSRMRLGFNDQTLDGDKLRSDDYYGEDGEFGFDASATAFALRFTNPVTGALMTDIGSAFEGNAPLTSQPIPSTLTTNAWLSFFQKQAASNPDDCGQQYLLAKAYTKSGANEAGEAHFAQYAAKYPTAAFARFLLAKFYDANGKGERAEALLSEMDTTTAPTFAGYHVRLLKINKEQNEEAYLNALEKILLLSPANWNIMSRYLNFLKDKGRKEQVKSFVDHFLQEKEKAIRGQEATDAKKRLEKWKKRLERFQEAESYKPASHRGQSDTEREKDYKNARKNLKKVWSPIDYTKIISYHKFKEKPEEVLRIYDEILAVAPWMYYYAEQKANYLFEKERNREALAVFQQLLEQRPYDSDLFEKIGDLHIEQKNEAEALRWYKLAVKTKGTGEDYAIGDKIEKLENRKKYNTYFRPFNIEAAAKDRRWESRYPDEESIISYFSQQLVYRPETKKIEALNKAVIHIRSDAGAKKWTEADLRPIGRISSAKVLKKDGTITSPDLGWGMAVFKNLQAGDVILVEGTNEQNMPEEIPGEFLELNTLSWQAPIVHSSLELLVPANLPLYVAANRVEPSFVQRDTGDLRLMHWQWSDIPKVDDGEDATPENYDPFAWLMIGSAPDWSNVVKWYQRQTYCRTEPNYEVLDRARALIRPGMREADIVETLHTFIVREINYSYVPFLNSNYVPKKPGATLSGKVGDCKDVATLMISLLREYGIPAWYTLVSTHSFSNREPRPTIYVFNHAIVAWQSTDQQLHFADLTTDYFPSGVLPEGDCGAWGLVIRDGESQLRRLPNHDMDPAISRMQLDVQAALDADGNLQLQTNIERRGVAAGHWREMLLRATPEERNKALSEYFAGGVLTHTDLEKIEFLNPDSLNAPLYATASIKAFNQLDKVSDLFIMPLPLPLSTPTQKALFAAKRYNDLDLDLFFEMAPVQEKVELQLPTGLKLAEMPQNRQIDSRFGRYTLSFEKTATGLRIQRETSFRIRFVDHKDFPEFKKFYLDMLDADDVLLAFRK